MPQLTLISHNVSEPPRTIDVAVGTNLMNAIIDAGMPIGSSCGAIAICAKCVVTILEGGENLSKANSIEKKLAERDRLKGATRISCQVKILGPVTITASYW